MDNTLEVENLAIRFGKQEIIRDLNFSVGPGDALAVIGPNGSGKTVLFKALVNSIPYQGQIRWAPGVRVGYVPQKLDLERDLPITGMDLVMAKAKVTRTENEVADAIRRVGLEDKVAKPIGELSGGQFQRLLVAMALIGQPSVLLLDEPTTGVDEAGQNRLNELVHGLRSEKHLTVLFISHELSVVYEYATHVLCLSHQRAWFGVPRKILTSETLQDIFGTPVDYHVHGP